MDNKKEKVIRSSVNDYKKLPKDKQMFVLGYMQGVLSTQGDKKQAQQDEPLVVVT